jgi:hypothetical protein
MQCGANVLVTAACMSKGNIMRKALLASAIAVVTAISPVTAAHAAKSFSYVTDTGGAFGNTLPINTNAKGQAVAGSFNDTFTFTTTKLLLGSFTFTSTGGVATTSPTYLNFTTATINGTPIPISVKTGGSLRTRTGDLLDFRLPAGLQTLILSGDAGKFGSYSGSFSLVAVPEASTWAMMIAGFGMIGGAMRRKTIATRKAVLA